MSLHDLGTQPPKGFRDILPHETSIRDQLIEVILKTYRSYGFERIETPIVEDVRRLTHSDGGENLGMLFKILKRGEKLDVQAAAAESENALVDLALRYDLTVPLARYYAHNRATLAPVFKAVQVGPSFRAERPQAGRFRQFYQCDIDILGGSAPADEAELLTASLAVYGTIGITNGCMRVNDRRILHAMVEVAGIPSDGASRALVSFDKLDKVGIAGVRELLQKDGFADQAIKTFLDIAQRVQELPSAARLAEIEKQLHTVLDARVCKQLASIIESVSPSAGNTIEFDPFLVRGMGYYTGPVFEFVVPGFSGSMGGGGRYDGLIGKLSGTECSACGFSIGFERIVALFGDRLLAATGHVRKIAVFFDDSADLSGVLSAAAELRATGAVASVFTTPKNMKAYLERVKKAGYTDFAKYAPGQSLTPKAIT